MKTGVRFVAAALVAVILAGAVPPVARAQQPAQQPGMMQEQMKTSDDTVYEVGANVFNAFYVPGKAITCTAGGVVALAVLLITFGTGYKAAAGTINEGCGGRWALTADDLKPEPEPYAPSR